MSIEDTFRQIIREELRDVRAALAALTPAKEESEYLTVQEAAKVASVDPESIRRWVKAGRLSPHRAGRELRVLRRDLEAFMSRDSGTPAGALDPAEAAAAILGRRPVR